MTAERKDSSAIARMLTPFELQALRQAQRDADVILKRAFPNARIIDMASDPKKTEPQRPAFEEVVRRMLNTPPQPKKTKDAPKKRTK